MHCIKHAEGGIWASSHTSTRSSALHGLLLTLQSIAFCTLRAAVSEGSLCHADKNLLQPEIHPMLAVLTTFICCSSQTGKAYAIKDEAWGTCDNMIDMGSKRSRCQFRTKRLHKRKKHKNFMNKRNVM